MKSEEFELNREDLMRFGINVLKYVVLPVAVYCLNQLQTSAEIDTKFIYTLILGAIVDLVHRFTTDHTAGEVNYAGGPNEVGNEIQDK